MSDIPLSDACESAIFSLEQVHFAYAREGEARTVLRDVNFSLFPMQKVGLYGPNGSGKTTFFRCITGLARPQQGLIRFHGHILSSEKDFRVLEDVAFGPLNLGLTPDKARQRALETLEHLGLAGFEQRLTHRLSGGEKKLISLATVLAMRPEALLLDEPTNGLDNDARQRIIDILSGLSTARITISHDWDFLAQTSTEYLTILDGRLTSCAPSFAHAHMHAHPLGNEPHEH